MFTFPGYTLETSIFTVLCDFLGTYFREKKDIFQNAVLRILSSGVIRENCTYMSSWQSYECFGLNYRMLVIESLDSDTETRRLSPVAVLGDGYLDLINGGTTKNQEKI